MSPRQIQDRPAGADALPSEADVMPARLVMPAPSAVGGSDQSEATELSQPNVLENYMRPAQPGAQSGRRRLNTLGWVSAAVIMLAAAGIIAGIMGDKSSGSKSAQQSSTSPDLSALLKTDNDQQSLHINYDTVIEGKKLVSTGSVAIQNEADSDRAFSVQRANGDDLFIVDTANGKIGIGGAPTGTAALQVAGNISANGSIVATGGNIVLGPNGLRIGNTLVCTANGCISSATSQPPAATLDVANVALLNKGQIFTGNSTFISPGNSFAGNGAGLTALNAANITAGTLDVNRLPASVPLLAGNNVFTGNNSFASISGTTIFQNGNQVCDSSGNCTYSSSQLSDSGNLARLDADQTFTGHNLFKNATNSTTAFQIQNANGTAHLFTADTLNARVAIDQASANYPLDVGGDINSTTGIRVGNNLVCDSSGCTVSSASANAFIQNGTALQTGNFAIQSSANNQVAALIRGASGQTADVLDLVSGDGGTNLLSVGGTGATTFRNSIDSTTAFQVQNASGTSLFNVDTSNSNISLGQLTTGALSAWTTSPNALPAARSGVAYVFANGYAYIIGGCTGYSGGGCVGTSVSTVYYAKLNTDGSTGVWQISSNPLPGVRGFASSIFANGYIYVIGGTDNTAYPNGLQSTVYYAKQNADGSTGTWQTSSNPLPKSLYSAESIVVNGYVYVMGGAANIGGVGTNQSTVYYAKLNSDGTTGAWQTDANGLPGANSAHSFAAAANGYIYYLPQGYYAKLNTDGSTGTWNQLTINGTNPTHQNAPGLIAGGYMYSLGGYEGAIVSRVSYAKVNPDGTVGPNWSANISPLPNNLQGGGAVTYNGYVYYLGGDNGSTASSAVYYASVQGLTRNGGQENITDQLTLGNGLNVSGITDLQATTDSGSIFSVQNASTASLINVDSINSIITLDGNTSGQLGQWQTNTNALPQTLMEASSITANGYVYEIGGNNGTADQSTVYYAKLNADGSTGAWQTNTNALPATRTQVTSIVANGYIYVIGGRGNPNGNSGNSTVYYAKLNTDGSTGVWQTATNSIPANIYDGTSVVSNGYVYAWGGGVGSSNLIYYAKLNADGSTGAWQTNANNLPQTTGRNGVIIANGYIYSLGGCIGGTCGGAGNTAVYYAKLNTDGSTGAWSTSANSLPIGLFGLESFMSNGYVYVMGGWTTTSGSPPPQSAVYYAKLNTDGSIGSWSTNTNSLPTGRGDEKPVVANGYVYQIGGPSGYFTGPTSTVYYASTSRVQIGANLDLVGLQSGDGSAGGSLTASNITSAGSLQVNGSGRFAQGVGIGGNLSVGGQAAIQTNSTAAFQVQNSSGANMLSVDTTNKLVSITGGATYNTSAYPFSFAAKSNYTTGTMPQADATADFNGNGKPDIVTANSTANTISVFMNNGNGTFAAQAPYTTGSYPISVTTADFNGDGKPDIAVANLNSNTVSVFMNNGDGTFAAKVDYVTGNRPEGVTTADFNGDGKPDIAVTNNTDNSLGIYLNSGTGTFTFSSNYTTGSGPYSVMAADFNGDGKQDLAVANSSASTISIFTGNGDGTFGAKTDYATGAGPKLIVGADFNGDGKEDLAVNNSTAGTISVLLNNGNGTFAAKTDYTTGASPWSIAAADFNGDGITDLTTFSSTTNALSALAGNGNGTFAAKTDLSLSIHSFGSATADFNGDGKPDIAAVDSTLNVVSVLLNNTAAIVTPHSASLSVASSSANTTGLTIQGAVGQTDDLLHIQNASGTMLAALTSSGVLETNYLDATSTASTLNIATTNARSVNIGYSTASLSIASNLKETGFALFAGLTNSATAFQIQSSGNTNVLTADTTGSTLVTISNLSVTGTITLKGHVVTSGTAPAIAAGVGAGTSPTVSISGNDQAGTVTVTTGTTSAAGNLATITFNSAYGSAPRVILTAANAGGATLQYYVTATTTTFVLNTGNAPVDATTYIFNYWIAQ